MPELDLDHLLTRSATLDERVSATPVRRRAIGRPSPAAAAATRRRVAAWSERLTVEGHNFLPQRLNAAGLSLSGAAAACSPELHFDCSGTSWLDPFLAGLADWGRPVQASENIAFVHLLGGFAAAAEDLVVAFDADGRWSRLSPDAQRSAEELLLRRLSAILQWCYYFSFDERRRTDSQSSHYEAFIAAASEQGWGDKFFTRFAGLGRPVGTAIQQWAKMILELLGRWEADREEVARTFRLSADHGIAAIASAGSDVHNHGRSVLVLDLTNGSRVVYKPTSAALTELWAEAQKVSFGSAEGQRAVIAREGYSWHYFVSGDHPATAAEYEPDYFEHFGRLLALATVLGACDLHHENFLPNDGVPELVDHETILTPTLRLRPVGGTGALRAAVRALHRSVLATGALPHWLDGPDGELWTVDAFGVALRDHVRGLPVLTRVNTDAMDVSYGTSDGGTSLPSIGNPGIADSLGRGFADGWRRVATVRSELRLLLAQFAAHVRVVIRDTRYYTHLLIEGYMPRYSTDVLDRSLLFERLYRPFFDGVPEDRWTLCRSEHNALIRGDVPYFLTAPDALALTEIGAGEVNPVSLPGAAPLSHALANIREMRAADGERNATLIRSALEVVEWPETTVRRVPYAFSYGGLRRGDWSRRFAVARELFDFVRRRAYTHRDGSVAQIGPHTARHQRAQVIGVIPPTDTYAGVAGFGLLAAALSRSGSSIVFRDWARRVADTLIGSAAVLKSRDAAGRCGAFAGSAGMAFAIAKIGALLDEPVYEDAALSILLAHGANREEASEPAEYDVISGWAGTSMVALVLARGRREQPSLDDYLNRAVDRLVAAALLDTAEKSCRWPSRSRSGISGFAHGSAGIAAALARAHERGIRETREIVAQALATEESLFDWDSATWPIGDEDRGGRMRAANVWCYGSGGILLALAEAEASVGLAAAAFLERVAETTMDSQPNGDSLCHGAGGVALCELRAGRLLDDAQLEAAGLGRLNALARRCLADKSLLLEPVSALEHDCGFMCGATGVGYALVAPEAGADAVDLLAIA